MATEIKTKTINKNIKALNKAVTAAEHMKSAYVKTREGNSSDRVKRHSYPIGDNRIYRYGVPKY